MSKPIIMWAAIVKTQRSEFIDHRSLHQLRKESLAEYLDGWSGLDRDWLMARVRFARVEVKEIT